MIEKHVKPQIHIKPELYVIAHNIRSMHNVGAIFRNADAFGIAKIFLTGYTGTPPDSRIHKVALGAEDFIPWEHNKSLARVVTKLRKVGVNIVVLENNINRKTTLLSKYIPRLPLALILGEEVNRNTKKILDLADDIIEIPMSGQKESLNVSVACGIALYGISVNKFFPKKAINLT